MQEKTYIAASNHLKISFLSQNFMRALGIAMMLFIPGIFTSVSVHPYGSTLKSPPTNNEETLFSSSFFYFSGNNSLVASSNLWIWFIIVILLSALTISLLNFSFHAQTAKSAWALLKSYLYPWRRKVSEIELGTRSMGTTMQERGRPATI
jgi:hypothetical protein